MFRTLSLPVVTLRPDLKVSSVSDSCGHRWTSCARADVDLAAIRRARNVELMGIELEMKRKRRCELSELT